MNITEAGIILNKLKLFIIKSFTMFKKANRLRLKI